MPARLQQRARRLPSCAVPSADRSCLQQKRRGGKSQQRLLRRIIPWKDFPCGGGNRREELPLHWNCLHRQSRVSCCHTSDLSSAYSGRLLSRMKARMVMLLLYLLPTGGGPSCGDSSTGPAWLYPPCCQHGHPQPERFSRAVSWRCILSCMGRCNLPSWRQQQPCLELPCEHQMHALQNTRPLQRQPGLCWGSNRRQMMQQMELPPEDLRQISSMGTWAVTQCHPLPWLRLLVRQGVMRLHVLSEAGLVQCWLSGGGHCRRQGRQRSS